MNLTRSSCAWLPPNSFKFAGNRFKRVDRGRKVSPFESGEGVRHGWNEVARRITTLSRELLHLPHACLQRGVIACHGLRERDVHVGEGRAGARERAVRKVVHHAPCVAVTRMPGKFPAPQERNRIVQLPTWRAAVHIGREGFREQPERHRRVAGLEFAQREMPTQMAEQQAIARICGEPGRQEAASGVRIALLVAQVRTGVSCPGVVRVLRERSIDLRASGVSLSILGERHAVMGREPPIVTVARGKPVQQVQQRALLPGAAGTADQAVGERGGAKHHHVSWPPVQVRR